MIVFEIILTIITVLVGLTIIFGLFEVRDRIAEFIYNKLPFIKSPKLRYFLMVVIFMIGYCLLLFGIVIPLFQKL